MSEIVLYKFKDLKNDVELDINTRFIDRECLVPTSVRYPLHLDGVRLSDEELAKLDIQVIGYTQDQLDEEQYSMTYDANSVLVERVREYKGFLDQLGVHYNANTDEIEEAIDKLNLEKTEQLELVTRINTTFHDIVVNLEAMGSITANFEAWSKMPKLIEYLPNDEVK